jgi:uncharacterized membrane protein YeaQ/YmgE (transglycosylase-associated protein family)
LDRRTRRAGTKRVIDARPRQPGADILVAGLIIGALARLIKPGKQNLGILATLGLGLVGSIIGGLIAQLFGTGSIWELNVIGFGLAVIAAVLLVGTAEAVVGKPPSRVICSVGPSGSPRGRRGRASRVRRLVAQCGATTPVSGAGRRRVADGEVVQGPGARCGTQPGDRARWLKGRVRGRVIGGAGVSGHRGQHEVAQRLAAHHQEHDAAMTGRAAE